MAYSNAVFDHQGGEAVAVHEDDAVRDLVGELARLPGVAGRSDEHALVRAPAGEGAEETLDLRSTHRALPAFGLDVHLLQPKPVEGDDSYILALPRSDRRCRSRHAGCQGGNQT